MIPLRSRGLGLRLPLRNRASFEADATRALVAGALGGALHLALVEVVPAPPWVWTVCVAAALSAVQGDRIDRVLLVLGAMVLPTLPQLFAGTGGWSITLTTAAVGLWMVRGRLCARGEEGALLVDRPGTAHFIAVAVASGLLGWIAVGTVEVLAASWGARAPAIVVASGSGAVLALFVVLATLPAHVGLQQHPVLARGERLLPSLLAPFDVLVLRALVLYRECGEELSRLPRMAAREDLGRTVSSATLSMLELAGEWSSLGASGGPRTRAHVAQELASLQKEASACTDGVARRHLETAATQLEDELSRLAQHEVQKDRAVARLRASLTLLERTKGALICVRSGHAQLRATELAVLTRHLQGLADSQREEAAMAHEVTAAVLDRPGGSLP